MAERAGVGTAWVDGHCHLYMHDDPVDSLLDRDVAEDLLQDRPGQLLVRVDETVGHGPPGLGVEHVGELERTVAVDDEVSVVAHEVDLVLVEDLLGELRRGELDERVELGLGFDAASVLTRGDDGARPEIQTDGLAARSVRGLARRRLRAGLGFRRRFLGRLSNGHYSDSYSPKISSEWERALPRAGRLARHFYQFEVSRELSDLR